MEHITREEFDAILAGRLDEDPEFRALLIADPRGVVAEIIGLPLPDVVRVSVHEESPTDIHLVLPSGSADLSESDLELVSGGGIWGTGGNDTCDSCTL